MKRIHFWLSLIPVVVAPLAVILMTATVLYEIRPQPTHETRRYVLEMGRFQISGEWILDTATGRVERIEDWRRSFPSGVFGTVSDLSVPELKEPRQ